MPSNTGSKSAKAIKAASRGRRGATAPKLQQIPWIALAAVAIIIAFIAAITINLWPKVEQQAELERWTPTEENKDPSKEIPGVETAEYAAQVHVGSGQRVAYDKNPPFGGPHDAVWATCTGTVYTVPVRTENMVHALEHGAVWIAYNPDTLGADGIAKLKSFVDGQQYMMLSPFPGLDKPIAVQSWGHQLKLESPSDSRIKQFITALRLNPYTTPEVGASCSTLPGTFDSANPPAFDGSPAPENAVKMDGVGADVNASVAPPAPPAPAPAPEPAPAP